MGTHKAKYFNFGVQQINVHCAVIHCDENWDRFVLLFILRQWKKLLVVIKTQFSIWISQYYFDFYLDHYSLIIASGNPVNPPHRLPNLPENWNFAPKICCFKNLLAMFGITKNLLLHLHVVFWTIDLMLIYLTLKQSNMVRKSAACWASAFYGVKQKHQRGLESYSS